MISDAETRAARWLEAWDRQGTHRTGTQGDRAGADWLAAEAAGLGAEVAIEDFAFDRLDPRLACLDIGDRSHFANDGGAIVPDLGFPSRVQEARDCPPLEGHRT